jgi:hypothetical protein
VFWWADRLSRLAEVPAAVGIGARGLPGSRGPGLRGPVRLPGSWPGFLGPLLAWLGAGGAGGVRAPCTRLARWGRGRWAPWRPPPGLVGSMAARLSPIFGWVLAFGEGLDRLPPWTRSAEQPPSPSPGQSAGPPATPSAGPGDRLTARPAAQPDAALATLAAAVDELAAQDLDGLADAARAERVLRLRRLLDRLEGHWLQELATLDARGAAGAEAGVQAPSTASWLRNRLRLGAGAASGGVRAARAVFRGPLDGHRPGPDRRRGVGRPRQRARSRHPGAGRPYHRRGRTGAAGGGPTPGPTPAAPGRRPPAAGRRPRGGPGQGRAAAMRGGACG